MKRKICWMLVLGAFLFLSACRQPDEQNPGKPEVTEPGKETDGWKPAGLDLPTSDKTVSLDAGKALKNLSVTGEDSPYYCNLEENLSNTGLNRFPVLVCRDPVYGITYYVNYGRDYYIYALRGGVSELAAAVPAKDLFCRDGELYFIADSYGLYTFDQIAQGNILKYSPTDGSIEIVVGQTVTEMIVYPDGICYGRGGETVKYAPEEDDSGEVRGETVYTTSMEEFYFSFAEEVSVPFPKGRERRRWKNYYFQTILEERPESDPVVRYMRELGYKDKLFVAKELELVDSGKAETPVLKKDISILDFFNQGLIAGDFLYYVSNKEETGQEHERSSLMSYHLETGEQKEESDLHFTVNMSGFIRYHNTLYFREYLRVSLEDGSQCQPVFWDKSQKSITAFYTDGDILFCLCNGKLWRMEETQAAAETIQEFIPGKPLPVGSYVYHLYAVGKTE